jgi:hypothetical protein
MSAWLQKRPRRERRISKLIIKMTRSTASAKAPVAWRCWRLCAASLPDEELRANTWADSDNYFIYTGTVHRKRIVTELGASNAVHEQVDGSR